MANLLAQADSFFALPPQASTTAGGVDWLFWYIIGVSVAFFVIILGVMVGFMFAYRKRPGRMNPEPSPSHNTVLEVVWSVIPLLLVMVMFYVGYVNYNRISTPHPDPYTTVKVEGKKWLWTFEYPNGAKINKELHVPAGQPINLDLVSTDIIHAFYVPAFRTKRDVVPGRLHKWWFQAVWPEGNEEDRVEYDLYCAEYCGTDHSNMIGKVVVHREVESFEQWVADNAVKPIEKLTASEFEEWLGTTPDTFADTFQGLIEKASDDKHRKILDRVMKEVKSPIEYGMLLWDSAGCKQCHAIEAGAPSGNGPNWHGLYGKEELVNGGKKVTVDEEYLKLSISDPQADKVDGYSGVMPPNDLSERDQIAIVEFIKSLAQKN